MASDEDSDSSPVVPRDCPGNHGGVAVPQLPPGINFLPSVRRTAGPWKQTGINKQPEIKQKRAFNIADNGNGLQRAYGANPDEVYIFTPVIRQKTSRYLRKNKKIKMFIKRICAIRMTHVNILKNYFLVEEDGEIVGMLSENISGKTLETIYSPEEGERPPLDIALNFAQQVTRAVHHLHADHIIHGQLEPSIVYVDIDTSCVKLRLFPKRFFIVNRRKFSSYTAPEFRQSSRPVSSKGEIYALACVLYKILESKNPSENMVNIPLRNDLPQPVSKILRKCWGEQASRPSAAQLLRVLRQQLRPSFSE